VIERSKVRLPAGALLGSKSGQVVHTHVPLSASSIIWYRPRGGDVLGNRRSGVTLAMRHRLSGLSTYGLKGQCARDYQPTYAPAGVCMVPLYRCNRFRATGLSFVRLTRYGLINYVVDTKHTVITYTAWTSSTGQR